MSSIVRVLKKKNRTFWRASVTIINTLSASLAFVVVNVLIPPK